jgi:uncharacterized LabA/DUF88 family protein
MNRAAIFIDGTYLNKLLEREFHRIRIDYHLLAQHLAQEADILRTYYYHCPPHQSNPPTEDELQRARSSEQFFAALRRLPRFQVRLGKLAYRGQDNDGRPIFIQKRVDIMLSVDMVQLAATRQITQAVLLAGDSDFVPAVEVAKRHGVLMMLWHGPTRGGIGGSVHHELWNEADERYELTDEIIQTLRR